MLLESPFLLLPAEQEGIREKGKCSSSGGGAAAEKWGVWRSGKGKAAGGAGGGHRERRSRKKSESRRSETVCKTEGERVQERQREGKKAKRAENEPSLDGEAREYHHTGHLLLPNTTVTFPSPSLNT